VRRFWLVAVAASVASFGARPARAQPLAGIELHWVASPGCPGSDDVQARARRLLGTEPPGISANDPLLVEGTVVASNGRYRLRLTVRREGESARETRVLESGSCESLAGAAALTLALLARGETRLGEGAEPTRPRAAASSGPASNGTPPARESPGAPTSSGASASSGPPAKGTPPTGESPAGSVASSSSPAPFANDEAHDEGPRGSPAAGWSMALQVPLLTVDEGLLPSWSYGVGVGAGVRVYRVRLMLAGILQLPQNDSSVSPYEARFQRRTGELSGCYAWPYGPFEVGPCLKMALEDVRADGSGPEVVSQSGHQTWLTLGVAARAAWAFGGWAALFLRPSLTFTTSRPTFAIDGVGPLYQVPLASAGIEIGWEWIL
jgi:hypothetical protein